ncbi:MAG: heme-binding protein [Candidatus Velthaea sp.]
MNEAYIVRGRIALSSAGAQAILAAAQRAAGEMGVDQCIAIVDASGALVAFSRMDGGRIGSIDIAITKAVSAATRRRATADEGGGDAAAGIRLAVASNNHIVNISGGLPIVVDDQTIGGIGVSSGTPDQDTVVAKAALVVLG